MGGTDREANVKSQHQKYKGKECVSEATISKLMNDFNCASMGTMRNEDQTLPSKDNPHQTYEEVVSSLKHLHLKKPINRRKRLKERKHLERKTKSVSADKYNISIAAISAKKPVLWPAKLSAVCEETESHVILKPSRLALSKQDEQPLSSCFSSCNSSCQEKSRIIDSLHKLDQGVFGNAKDKILNNQVSFSELSKKNGRHLQEGAMFSQQLVLPGCPSGESSNGLKTGNYRGCSSIQQHDFTDSRSYLHSHTPHRIPNVVATSKSSKRTEYSGQQSVSSSHELPLPTHFNVPEHLSEYDYNYSAGVPPLDSRQPSSSTSISGLTPERSCSEEMRMEESNVNELASYFEDLLHIPRKMSVMAEMMYA